MGSPNLLHTNTKYDDFGYSLPFDPGDRFASQAAALEVKEIAFYQSFFPGCSSYDDFIARLRELFINMREDAAVFRAFENTNLEKEFKDFGLEMGTDVGEIEITYSATSEDIDIEKLLGNIAGVSVSGGVITIGTDVDKDITIVKEVFNKLFNTRYSINSKTGGASKRRLNEFFNRVEAGGDKALNELSQRAGITISGIKGGVRTAQTKVRTSGMFDFNAESIKNAENDPKLKGQINDALNRINTFITGIAYKNRASQIMLNAIKDTWNNSFSSEKMRSFFFEKGGFLTYLKGAFGEFQTALFSNYLRLATGNSHLPEALISDTIKKGGEQNKSDVELLKGIGAQVKNINLYATNKIESNIHLNNLSAATAGTPFSIDVSSFEGFLANYFFNTDYQSSVQGSFEQLETILGGYFAEIMNLAINDAVDDKVTFYFIGGGYLVPGSHILNQNHFERVKVSITSGYKGMSDEEYMSRNRPRGRKNQPFLNWWQNDSSAEYGFSATDKNSETFANIISKISISTGFFHGGAGGLGRYSIF